MIGTLVAILEDTPVLPYAFWAAGGALLVAAGWTSFNLRRRIAEIRIDGPWVQVRSVADVAARRSDPARRVLDVRRYGRWAHVAVGLTSYVLEAAAWPAFDELLDALSASQEW